MDKIKSRKLWVAIVGILLQLLNTQLTSPLNEDQMMQITALIIGYLISQGWVDGKEANGQ